MILAVSAATLLLEHSGRLHGFETTSLDTFLQLRAPSVSPHVTVVILDDHDYRALFRETSPLDPARLGEILRALIAGGPAVIGVDLDTSAPVFRGVLDDLATLSSPPIVWGRDAQVLRDSSVRAFAVLGRDAAAPAVRTGLALLPRDPDGVVRRHRFTFRTEGDGQPLPSLPQAVVQAYRKEPGIGGSGKPLVLNFFGDTYRFPLLRASRVLEVARGEGWQTQSPIRGRIVLLGATYRAARDEYVTPAGPRSGVMLVAHAVESELSGGGIRTANHASMLILEIACGIGLVYIHHRYHERPALAFALNLVGLPVLACVGSLLAFSAFAYWANFIPILAAVTIHQVADHLREARRCRETLSSLVAERQGGGETPG